MRQFLLVVAAANMEILRRAPGDAPKLVSLGGVVLTTASLGALSCAFALHMALHLNVILAVILGAGWGAAIANLDRWLIAATARQRTVFGNVLLALPRFVLALIIGVVVSTPLTLQIFASEINNELTVMQAEQQASFTQQLSNDPRFRDLPRQQAKLAHLRATLSGGVDDASVYNDPQVADLRGHLDDLDAQLADAEQAVVCEKEGTCGSGKVGAGPAFHEKVQLRDRLRKQRQQTKKELDTTAAQVKKDVERSAEQNREATRRELAVLAPRIGASQAAYDRELAANAAAVQNSDGLLARLEALERIGAGNQVLLAAHLALIAFLTALECLPVLFKLLLNLGKPSLYEHLCTVEDDSTYDKIFTAFRTDFEERHIDVQASLIARQARREREMQAEMEATQRALDAQKDLAAKAVQEWKARQERRMEMDPDAFLSDDASAAEEPDGHRAQFAM